MDTRLRLSEWSEAEGAETHPELRPLPALSRLQAYFRAATCSRIRSSCLRSSGVNSSPKSSASKT